MDLQNKSGLPHIAPINSALKHFDAVRTNIDPRSRIRHFVSYLIWGALRD
jgi:hypothetical protein